jgi:predicted ester cyclase
MATLKEIADNGLAAWRARDVEGFAEQYSDSAVVKTPGGGELHGREGARQFFGLWNEAMPDNEIEITNEVESGSMLVQEGIFRGTHTGNLATPDGQQIPPTGRRLEASYCDVFEFSGDQIVNEHLYFDQVDMLVQLGLMPQPEAAAAS